MGEYNWDPIAKRFKSDEEICQDQRNESIDYHRARQKRVDAGEEEPYSWEKDDLTLFGKIRKNRDRDRWPIAIGCFIMAIVAAFFGPIGLAISGILLIVIIVKLIYDILFITVWILTIGFIGGGIIVAIMGGPPGWVAGGISILIGFGVSKLIKHF